MASELRNSPPPPLRDLHTALGVRFADIVDQYLSVLPGTQDAMRDAASLGTAQILATVAHRLAGRSAALGATEVAQLCRALETACSANDQVPADALDRLSQIKAACDAFSQQLSAITGHVRASSG